jgi:hypothetical protein
MHLVPAAGTGLFVAAYVAAFAIGSGWTFGLYSLLTTATALVLRRIREPDVDHCLAAFPSLRCHP